MPNLRFEGEERQLSGDIASETYVAAIKESGLSIYEPIPVGDPEKWIPSPALEEILDVGLRGFSVAGLPLRTRSKVVKEKVCELLGYPIPKSFQKTQPRFPGQLFDTYVQKNNNLQIWNEEISGTRRYVLIRVTANDVISRVKVVTGDTLARLDTTGKLTTKYQAGFTEGPNAAELIGPDVGGIAALVKDQVDLSSVASPVQQPREDQLLSIAALHDKLAGFAGERFKDAGIDQERNRGAVLHSAVCQALGYKQFQDDGRFPDVRHQLLELKLQTSPTIDLGLVQPTSEEPLDVPMLAGAQVRHCDVRYAVFSAATEGGWVTIKAVVLVTGARFFERFAQFQGKVLNAKLQIPLPNTFFDT